MKIENIAVGFEITLLMLVILGRWFLPKGNISRSTLSQLLLVYMVIKYNLLLILFSYIRFNSFHILFHFFSFLFEITLNNYIYN